MTEKKEELKYIGRYGEILEDVKETKKSLEKQDPRIRILEAIGLDETGVKRKVLFRVSRKTGKKHGRYTIFRPEDERQTVLLSREEAILEECNYLNDLLHGKHTFYDDWGRPTREIYFLRGRQLKGKEYDYSYRNHGVWTFGHLEKKHRENTAKKSHELRELFADASVKEAVKTGSLLKVKSAMTRALKKKEMSE